jgi:valyl-tRNA synthetase
MSQSPFPILDKNLDLAALEEECRTLWQDRGVYDYDPNSSKPTFSIDTPPPYVSAAHLHVGHAMSYTQAEIAVRYKRMKGFNIFYPMGFDDNGLPTERYVEQTYNIDKKKITRSEFRKLCMEETARGAVAYEKLWRAMGLSVDWSLRYSTIDDHCRHVAQKSFLDLYHKGLVKRENEPVLWDTHFETALAQADLDTITRTGKMVDIAFDDGAGNALVISTTRPELLPACVGLFVHPEDSRYTHLHGKNAIVPIAGHSVKIYTSEDVDPEFGTGLMMCCTFGDGEDVKKWKAHHLETRFILTPNGRMNELAGAYAGLPIVEARARIIKDLDAAGLLLGQKPVQQNVSVGERSGEPVEFILAPQWFIQVMNHKESFLKRSAELKWFPDWMKTRLDQWIEGLKYNWNISRQRFYGVPFPIWYVQETGDVIVAQESDLPIDPMESAPPAWAVEKYKGLTIVPESDVMDTWMTSSLSPLINANWTNTPNRKGDMSIYPMSLRVQGFEIIRTWLFYTMVKSDFHTDSLPWENVMISGWGLNEQGKKISKRDLEKFTDADGYNRYEPYALIEKYGADAVRYWASNSQLGHDLKFLEKDVKDGRKIVVKLWNVARMAFIYLDGFNPKTDLIPISERLAEDQWILHELSKVNARMSESFEAYDYATGKEALNRYFWMAYCDDYLELIKSRFWVEAGRSDQDRRSAQSTLYESLRVLLGLFAPYIPYITESIYQKAHCFGENTRSLHQTAWPSLAVQADEGTLKTADTIRKVQDIARKLRSDQKIGMGTMVDSLTFYDPNSLLKSIDPKILCGAARCTHIGFTDQGIINEGEEFAATLKAYEDGAAPTMTSMVSFG